MPAEWAPHAATWIAWPHHEPDWPGKLEAVRWVYAEIVRVLHAYERVEILCHNEDVREDARTRLNAHACNPDGYRLHVVPNDRVWLRDSAPTFVHDEPGNVNLVNWSFNAWAKYDNYTLDIQVGTAIEEITGQRRFQPRRPDGQPVVLEGGAIEANGTGLLMVTEECLLSKIQERNPGLDREGYETIFREWLGIDRTIWLGEGCEGDDTHGHIDDIARFVSADTLVLAVEVDPADDENHRRSMDNLRRLEGGGAPPLRILQLPYPRPVIMDGQRLPASYANFYIANGIVMVPTFNDPMDRVALAILADCFPDREVCGIHSVDLVWGLGTLHCLTQQEPSARAVG
ncbi:MAG TPA: agmatine deiminase family protein [Gemmatimonadaceae bacterium]|nr:agmatine deiminase family protein [Gemmatimonadaceae bacterium]